MRALMKTRPGVGHFEVRDIEKPAVKNPDDVLIEVRAAGVCGTDMHIYHDTFKSYPPVVLGHEFSGVVAEVGDGVTRVKLGDRVVCEPHTCFCGQCDMCRAGKIQLCAQKRSPGWGIDGAFTDYLVVPELFLHHVPDNVPDDVAALAEPLAIVTHEVLERCGIEPQDTVAVVGGGPIGLLAAFAAKAGGAGATIVLGREADEQLRFPAGKKLGIDHLVNSNKVDPVAEVLRLTGGKGADVVVEASGSESGVNTAINAVKKCGRITVIGIPGAELLSVQWRKMVHKVLDVYFNMSSSVSSWERALSIMKNTSYDLSSVISHHASIEDWQQVFDDIKNKRAIKAMFIPDRIKEDER